MAAAAAPPAAPALDGGSNAVMRREIRSLLPGLAVGRELGKGAFGVVYMATTTSAAAAAGAGPTPAAAAAAAAAAATADADLVVPEQRALKVIHKGPLAQRNPKFVENVRSEIKLLRVASTKWSPCHPNIVRLYQDTESPDTGNIYLLMEYCPGGDLKHFLGHHGLLPVSVAKRLTRQLKDALQFLRHENIIHRDLKPQNLLLTSLSPEHATLKVADFGLARMLSSESLANTVCGSPLYMAPELLKGEQYGEKVDLWSVGAILYEMVTGRHVYTVSDMQQLMVATKGNPTLILAPGVNAANPHCRPLLTALLQIDPSKRITFSDFFNHPFLLPEPPSSAVMGTTTLEGPSARAQRPPDRVGGADDESKQPPAATLAVDPEGSGVLIGGVDRGLGDNAVADDAVVLETVVAVAAAAAGAATAAAVATGATADVAEAGAIKVGDDAAAATSAGTAEPDGGGAGDDGNSDVHATDHTDDDDNSGFLSGSDGGWEILGADDYMNSDACSDEEADEAAYTAEEDAAAPSAAGAAVAAEAVPAAQNDTRAGATPVAQVAQEEKEEKEEKEEGAGEEKKENAPTSQELPPEVAHSATAAAAVAPALSTPAAGVVGGEAEVAVHAASSVEAGDTKAGEEKEHVDEAKEGAAAALRAAEISYDAIAKEGAVVLFFHISSTTDGAGNDSTYMAFHNGKFAHHYLDLNCVEALRRTRSGSGSGSPRSKLPRYHIGVVLLSETLAASPTQNPYNLPEGTPFTVLTARPLRSDEQFPPAAAAGSGAEPATTTIQFRSFTAGGTVLCLPMTAKKRRVTSSRLAAPAASTDGDVGEFVAFNEVPGRPMYKVSPESVAAFQRKNKRKNSRQSFLVGKIVMIAPSLVDGACGCDDSKTVEPNTFVLTLAPL